MADRRKNLRSLQTSTIDGDFKGLGATFSHAPITVGMLACGGMMGPYHTEDFQHGRISTVVSVYDTPATAKDIAARYGVPNAFFFDTPKKDDSKDEINHINAYNQVSLDAFLDTHKLTVISSPNSAHVEQAKYILKRDDADQRFLYIEKPPSNSLEGTVELAQLEQEHQGQIGIVSQNRMWDMLLEAKHLLSQNIIGEIQDFEVEYQQDWMNANCPAVWRARKGIGGELGPDDEGNIGKLMDIAYHAVDTLQFVTGKDITNILRAHIKNIVKERTPAEGGPFGAGGESESEKVSVGGNTDYHGDDVLNADVELEGGGSGHLKVSQTNCGNQNKLKFTIYGSKGRIIFDTEDSEHLRIQYDFNDREETISRNPNNLTYVNKLPFWLRDGLNMNSRPFQYFTPPGHNTGWRDVHRRQAQAWALYSQLVSQKAITIDQRRDLYMVPTAAEGVKVMRALKGIYETQKAQKDYRLDVKHFKK